LEPKDRIAELCNRATTEENPAALKRIMDELKAALAEYIREARRMTLLHFDYFRKHEEFSPEAKRPQDEHVKKTDLIETDLVENHENSDKNKIFSEQDEKKAS
jgi:hypothetical protein